MTELFVSIVSLLVVWAIASATVAAGFALLSAIEKRRTKKAGKR